MKSLKIKISKLTGMFLTFALLLCLGAFANVVSAEEADGFTYSVSEDGKATITKYNGTATKLDIPSELGGCPVTSIGGIAFAFQSSLKSITIPDSVTSIGMGAFFYSGLTSITIPDSITGIGEEAFSSCYELEQVTIGNGVTSIGEMAFYECSSLTSITIGNSVTSIGYEAFSGCSSLKSITIPDSVISIGSAAFIDCNSLTSITIPSSVTSIGERAFSGCRSLTSITIPSSVTSIGERAFSSCRSLTSIEVSGDNSYYSSIEGVLFNKNKTEIVKFPAKKSESYVIPDSVTSIGSNAFSGCSSLTSIEIPDSVTSIGSGAFSSCSGLTSIEIPDSVTSIGNSAFAGCSGFTSIEIPASVTSIGGGAFSSCSGLKSITIPGSVTNIGSGAFRGCNNLKTVYYYGTEEEFQEKVNADGQDRFEGADVILLDEKTSGFTFEILGSVLETEPELIPARITGYTDKLKGGDVTLPSEIKVSMSIYGFRSDFTSIEVTSIRENAFFDCENLKSITIPSTVTEIGKNAFDVTKVTRHYEWRKVK